MSHLEGIVTLVLIRRSSRFVQVMDTTSKASPVSNLLGKKKAAALEPKKQKSAAPSGSPTAAELREAKKIVAAAAKAKKEKEGKNFYCPPELIAWKRPVSCTKSCRTSPPLT